MVIFETLHEKLLDSPTRTADLFKIDEISSARVTDQENSYDNNDTPSLQKEKDARTQQRSYEEIFPS